MIRGLALTLLALTACGDRAPDAGEVLFQTGALRLTVSDLQRELAAEPPAQRRRFNASVDEKKRYLQRLVQERLLFEEARRRKLDQDPALQRRFRAMVNATLLRQVYEQARARPITDADIQRYRDGHPTTFVSPPVTRFARAVLATREAADRLIAALPAAEKTAVALQQLVAAHTVDEATRPHGGDMGYLRRKDPRLSPTLLAAAEALEAIGDHTPPTEADGRWIVLIKTGGRPSIHRSADSMQPHIRMRLLADRREEAVKQLVDRLRGKAATNDTLLEGISAPDQEDHP